MTIQLHIEADNVSEFMTMLKAFAAVSGETVIADGSPAAPRRGRPPGTKATPANDAGTGAATTAPADDDPLGINAAGKGNGQTAGGDIFGDDKPAAPPAATPAFKTPEDFIEAVKKLLGKGKDDAVRGKLKELGFEKVRDVPPDKYTSTLTELGKV